MPIQFVQPARRESAEPRPTASALASPTAIVGALLLAACSGPSTASSPTATAARSFRPISALFFLPDRPPVTEVSGAGLVPDSKIEWDLRVTAQNLGLGGVEVRVDEQHAHLGGVVPTVEARDVMLETARRTSGVKAVTDSIEIRP